MKTGGRQRVLAHKITPARFHPFMPLRLIPKNLIYRLFTQVRQMLLDKISAGGLAQTP